MLGVMLAVIVGLYLINRLQPNITDTTDAVNKTATGNDAATTRQGDNLLAQTTSNAVIPVIMANIKDNTLIEGNLNTNTPSNHPIDILRVVNGGISATSQPNDPYVQELPDNVTQNKTVYEPVVKPAQNDYDIFNKYYGKINLATGMLYTANEIERFSGINKQVLFDIMRMEQNRIEAVNEQQRISSMIANQPLNMTLQEIQMRSQLGR